MNQKVIAERARILACLCEGVGINATSRMTGAAKNTILKQLAEVGQACLDYQHEHLTDLPCKRIQADKSWSFCYAKNRNVPEKFKGKTGYGDI